MDAQTMASINEFFTFAVPACVIGLVVVLAPVRRVIRGRKTGMRQSGLRRHIMHGYDD